ncbi:MAG: LptF/LptG family permease [Candidatus Omnitrophota bacterium]|nr:LptF/LptG family permease [Candidatus Omnitrophota bacterium]
MPYAGQRALDIMKIIDRYMVKGFAPAFIWCLFIFIIMAVIIDIFSFIDDIVKYKIPAASIWAFYVYYSPTIFIQVAPMAVLLSTIYVLSNLNKHNEITAMKSSGISLWRILSPILIMGFLISMAVFIVNDRIIPPSSRKAGVIRREELEKEKRKFNPVKIENVALYGAGNRIIFARNYDTQKMTLGDIIIHQHDASANLTSKLTAQTGSWTGEGWKFSRVLIYKIDNAGRILGEPEFHNDAIIPLKEKPSDFANREWRSDYMSYKELNKYIRNFRGTGNRLVKNLLVELHYKISFPLISLIIILVGAPFAIITTRGGVLIGIGMSIAIGLLYYASIAISLAFGKAGILPPIVAAWFGNVTFAILGIHLINKRT